MKELEARQPTIESSSREEARKIFVFNRREYDVLNFTAQGITSKEIGRQISLSERTVKETLTGINKKLGTNNALQATQRGLDLGVVDKQKLLEGFNFQVLSSLTDHEHLMMQAILADEGENRLYENLADKFHKSPDTAKKIVGKILGKFEISDVVRVAAIYKSALQLDVAKDFDAIVCVDTETQKHDPLSRFDLTLLQQLYQGKTLDDLAPNAASKASLYSQLRVVYRKISTPARLAALIRGFKDDLIFLPGRDEKLIDTQIPTNNLSVIFKLIPNFSQTATVFDRKKR